MLQYKKQTAFDIQEIRFPDCFSANVDLFQFNHEEMDTVVKRSVENWSL